MEFCVTREVETLNKQLLVYATFIYSRYTHSFILWCVARLNFWSEISMFSYNLDLMQKSQGTIHAVGHMSVMYQ